MESGEWRVMISPSPTLPEREGATRGQVCLMVNGNGNEKWKMENGKLWEP